MSKSKRRRRPDGHPAKVAARRRRDAAKRAALRGLDGLARRLLGEVQDLSDAMAAEVWASQTLGMICERPDGLEAQELVAMGTLLLEAIARVGGAPAYTALVAIGAVDGEELGARASKLAERLELGDDDAVAAWVAELGAAEIVGAAVLHEDVFDDARTVFLEAVHPGGERHVIGVLIDNNLGSIARDILIADSIDEIAETVRGNPQSDAALRFERVAPGIAAGQIHLALELTDMTWQAPVSEDFGELRAVARLRADEADGYMVPSGDPDPGPALAALARQQ